MSHQPDIDKVYLYTKDPHKTKYQLLINKHEHVGLINCNKPQSFYWILEWFRWYLQKYWCLV